jgi:diadenosine tetraphosphate (Ap4A) HIT family hydrolase
MIACEVYLSTDHCSFASTRDPVVRAWAGIPPDVLPGSGAIIPIAHRTSVFDLTPEEWADTRDLLLEVREVLHRLYAPDGYLLGWNQGGTLHPHLNQGGTLHPHLHVIPRFDDEPLSGRGLRSAINVPENRRPDPWTPGTGRAVSRPPGGIA